VASVPSAGRADAGDLRVTGDFEVPVDFAETGVLGKADFLADFGVV